MFDAPDHSDREVELRFYEELNDFLAPALRGRGFVHRFSDERSVKDLLESLGVPHPEIDLILVDGVSVDFDHRVRGGERISVYPVFERLDIAPVLRLRPTPLRVPRFVCDVHLGSLARDLRVLGFDTLYAREFGDATIARIASLQRRIVLTRDRGLLMRRAVTRGHWLRSTDPFAQTVEVVRVLQLRTLLAPFTRCRVCNAKPVACTREEVADSLPAHAVHGYEQFVRCPGCGRVYWQGSHYDRLRERIDRIVRAVAREEEDPMR